MAYLMVQQPITHAQLKEYIVQLLREDYEKNRPPAARDYLVELLFEIENANVLAQIDECEQAVDDLIGEGRIEEFIVPEMGSLTNRALRLKQ